MLTLRNALPHEAGAAMEVISMAKAHLKAQGIDQWQTGYPDLACIQRDLEAQKGYFLTEDGALLGYLCADFDGEPAYRNLQGTWHTGEPYLVVHRLALSDAARGRGLSLTAFCLAEDLARGRGVHAFRVDTDEANAAMRRILEKAGFSYCGTIWFDNSEKIAFDKPIA